ncbi:MAG: HAMP domain-containing sensor histidine kinase, partial [Bacteroidota bacterium]
LLADIRAYINIREKEVEWEWCSLNSIVERLLDKHHTLIAQKDAYIETSQMPTIVADSHCLNAALEQLILNSLTYSDSQPLVIHLAHEQIGDSHYLFVEDNGFGIPEPYQAQVFEMFKRLNDRRKFKGSGLGLSIAQRGMEKMAGKVELVRSNELGSLFRLQLPIHQVPPTT